MSQIALAHDRRGPSRRFYRDPRDQQAQCWLGQVTRPRLTQIMDLLDLAPEIQEEILSLPAVAGLRRKRWTKIDD